VKILYSAYACHRDTENTELFIIFVDSDFSHELQLIAFIYIWFRLDGELLFFACLKKSNQKKGHAKHERPGRVFWVTFFARTKKVTRSNRSET
jgi:hypothetical protein